MSENENIQTKSDETSDEIMETLPNSSNDFPFNLDNIKVDYRTAKIISPAYSTKTGELNAILEYLFQATVFENMEQKDTANTLFRLAQEEMSHFSLLAKTLIRLGVAPIYTFFPPQRDMFYSARYVNFCTEPKKMLQISIQGEQFAINQYTKILNLLENSEVKNIITYILEQEKQHLATLLKLQNDQ